MTVRRRTGGAIICTAATSVPLACSSDSTSSGSDGGFSVASSLRQIRETARGDTLLATMGDLDAATKAAGTDRPAPGTTDVDEVSAWLTAIAGPVQEGDQVVSALLPRVAQYERFAQMAEFRDELGWSLTDVRAFVEYAVPPEMFTVTTGSFDTKALSAALGTADHGM